MTPLPSHLRRLVLWHIPQLKRKDLDRIDSLLALRYHLLQQDSPDIDKIKDLTRQVNEIITPYDKQYQAVIKQWTARRQLNAESRKYIQFPFRLSHLPLTLKNHWKYVKDWPSTIFPLALNRGKYLAKRVFLLGP